MVVLVTIERVRGEVGGLEEQDWTLRVTQVYRREGGEWQLVHRHLIRLRTASAWIRQPPLLGATNAECAHAHLNGSFDYR
jgi:hypothetical protein